MAFSIKTIKQIVDDMIATVRSATAQNAPEKRITDFNRGSVVRTFIEAVALQLADLYVQLAKLRELFSLDLSSGADLDDRAEDYAKIRASANNSFGYVKFGDSRNTRGWKVKSETVNIVNNASTYITLGTFTDGNFQSLPLSGTVILERDDVVQREYVSYSAVDVVTSRLTISVGSVTKTHPIGSTVILSWLGSDKVIGTGVVVQVAATSTTEAIEFTTQAPTTFVDGEVYSPYTLVSASAPGAAGNVAAGAVNTFGSVPWPTATVINDAAFGGGSDIESDASFRDRIKYGIQTLTKATIRSVEVGANGVSSGASKVIYSKVVEDVSSNEVRVYINDGNFVAPAPIQQPLPEVLILDSVVGKKRGKISKWPVDGDVNLWKSASSGLMETLSFSIGGATMSDSSKSWGVNDFQGYFVVDSNKNFFEVVSNTSNSIDLAVPVLPNPAMGSYAVIPVTDAPSRLVRNTEYYFNETTGDVELVSGLGVHDALVVYPALGDPSYSYYDGIIKEVQRVLNGDPSDFVNYPGIKAAGVKTKVLWPDVVMVDFTLYVSAISTVSEASTYTTISAAVELYVNKLNIGDSVVISEVIAAVMGVSGVADVRVVTPSANVIVLDNQMARTAISRISIS